MTTYRDWLYAQFRRGEKLTKAPELDLQDFDKFRELVLESEKRAAKLGLPKAVRTCKVRSYRMSFGIVRQVLA